MKQLYLCEKPSQAKDIARVLGANVRKDGYFEGQGIFVTWCFGHLLEMAAPEDYDPGLKQWRMESLPIIPERWVVNVRKDAKKQYRIIVALFKQVDKVVIATDADREGESIAREVMALGKWQGPVMRLWLSALDDASIRKALSQLLPGDKTEPLYQAATARSRADWLIGMNLSRAYTLAASASGVDGVISVGRVQSPTLKLVVDRDLAIEQFNPVPFYELQAIFAKDAMRLTAQWQVPEELGDAERRCLSQDAAQAVAEGVLGQTGRVVGAKTLRKQESPPLPYSLSSLQQEASKRYDLGAQAVLDSAQALYETYKATTYPRTDCHYLPESQLSDAGSILSQLGQQPAYRLLVQQAEPGLQSKAWNDQKITAHHAIIPTIEKVNTDRMKPDEIKLYELICRRYLAQFYPAYEYYQTRIDIQVNQALFTASGRVPIIQGWKIAIGQAEINDQKAEPLPPFKEGDQVKVVDTAIKEKQTRPPEHFTEGTLIQAMKSIGKTVRHPALNKILKDTSGIGTEATRASIIEILLKRGFIVHKKKHLISTVTARTLIALLPGPVKDPATTAVWEQALENIATGELDAEKFIDDQTQMVITLTERVKAQNTTGFKQAGSVVETYACPECQQPLKRRKGKAGWFWGCTGYPDCTLTLPDAKGKPGKPRQQPKATGETCPECQQGDRVERTIKKGNKRGQTFFGCSRFPDCGYTEFV